MMDIPFDGSFINRKLVESRIFHPPGSRIRVLAAAPQPHPPLLARCLTEKQLEKSFNSEEFHLCVCFRRSEARATNFIQSIDEDEDSPSHGKQLLNHVSDIAKVVRVKFEEVSQGRGRCTCGLDQDVQ
ncbi:hypothetical protein DBV05_g9698 [Lasiodiplodia theobromae]|uniref:Uncharacterized protein n=1 Tax=Lasiodiplodia theobromae TaxID=45133 RepID=A0A5N5D2T8_9PEZI|nr:hypothetical protein DBV05_g9698 [Lasiodiplodia theobromae]